MRARAAAFSVRMRARSVSSHSRVGVGGERLFGQRVLPGGRECRVRLLKLRVEFDDAAILGRELPQEVGPFRFERKNPRLDVTRDAGIVRRPNLGDLAGGNRSKLLAHRRKALRGFHVRGGRLRTERIELDELLKNAFALQRRRHDAVLDAELDEAILRQLQLVSRVLRLLAEEPVDPRRPVQRQMFFQIQSRERVEHMQGRALIGCVIGHIDQPCAFDWHDAEVVAQRMRSQRARLGFTAGIAGRNQLRSQSGFGRYPLQEIVRLDELCL